MVDLQDFRIPAHRFRQGGRDVYACALNLTTLNASLPDRIDDRVVRDANRQLTPSHARRIQAYLAERDDWVLSALMLGVPPEAVEFRPYVEGDGAPMHVGELRIRADSPASMKMFDGQHRRRAIKDLFLELAASGPGADKLSALEASSLPIMLYVEDDIEALRQMFADAAQTKPIEANVVAQFDLRDPFNLAALWLEENSDLFGGRVEKERASVPRTSECIIAINQLSATLKTVLVGYRGRVSKDLSDQYMLTLDDLNERCWTWSDDFMPSAREEYEWLVAGEIDNSEIPLNRATSLDLQRNRHTPVRWLLLRVDQERLGLDAIGRVYPERVPGTGQWPGRAPSGRRVGGRGRHHSLRSRPAGGLGNRSHRQTSKSCLRLTDTHIEIARMIRSL